MNIWNGKYQRDKGDIVKYKEFKLNELFDLINNPQLDKNNFEFDENGAFPYFTRTEKNNGVFGYVKYLDEAHKIKGNSLAVGMISKKFHYMNHDFYAGQFTKTAIPKFNRFNEKIAQYFIAILNKHNYYFQSALVRDFNKLFLNLKVLLPSKDNISPDFDFMENYIKNLELEYINTLEKQINEELNLYLKASGLNDITICDDDLQFIDKDVEYKKFLVGDLFNIKTGRDVIINTLYDGEYPLISHQCNNNGITKRISELNNRNKFNFKDTIPLADRGVFHASCQNEDFYIGTRVKALTFKDGEKTENQRLFIVGAINKLQILFSDYLTNATDKLPNLEIYLPITPEGNPNYDYMDKYIRIIKKIVIKNIFEKQNEKLNMIKKICEN